MENKDIKELLTGVAEGSVSVEDALLELKKAPFEEIGIASLDHHRAIRQGAAEVVYGAGKTPEQINPIIRNLWERGQKTILITRLSTEKADKIDPSLPFTYYEEARLGLVGEKQKPKHSGYILVATGGTSDIPVA